MAEVTQAEIDAVDEMDDALGFLTEVERPILARAFARHRINALRSLADDQAMVEQAARAMCREGGFDPNEIMPNDGQRWRYYVPAVQAVLRAHAGGME